MQGKGQGGQGRGLGRKGGLGRGLGGSCACPTCGVRVPHERGNPCFKRTCPKCGAKMTRAD